MRQLAFLTYNFFLSFTFLSLTFFLSFKIVKPASILAQKLLLDFQQDNLNVTVLHVNRDKVFSRLLPRANSGPWR